MGQRFVPYPEEWASQGSTGLKLNGHASILVTEAEFTPPDSEGCSVAGIDEKTAQSKAPNKGLDMR
jgi:hypothetical protein